ncbi:iron complex transport system ATP-binding protein [Scopulibacillus darangshiensis]|uniref:Iron complex transport system ATP-binding protein n=1 Tax=Scopulibacillus darangshiensis TaxID=442528 RepID=A0A4V2SND1_9BACL|nr:ABC transporter ATP-binding protein [Scopulibacillus darangshiensis]TCP30636.1 iron complex transport system ATP-binding protein [Scopulibacillus darangshiensis]
MSILEAKDLSVSYGDTNILDELNLKIPKGKITVFIGKNGCGKSTLLSTFARITKPTKGSIILDGKSIAKISTKKIARELALLPQGPSAPEGMNVLQLVKQGRYPYQNWMKQWSREDEEAVSKALSVTGTAELADRPVEDLSGGQKQRVWIAMVLAQDTDTILLDEPTTYLDLSHQIEILDLLYDLNQNENRTIVMVLHDLNLACRYADHIVAIQDKHVFAQGAPEEIMSCDLVKDVFGMDVNIVNCPLFGTPMCIPYGKGRNVKEGRCTAVAY